MDYVPGVPIESLGGEGVAQKERDRVGALLQGLMYRELFEFRTMQSDPNFANYLYRPGDGKIVLLDLGSTVTFSRAFTNRYAHISRALIAGDDHAVRHYAEQIGYVNAADSSEHAERLLTLIRMVCSPICHEGLYDFGASDLLQRTREKGFEMFLHHASDFRAPPPDTAFLHRKLMGTFHLCARIKARANAQALIRPYLAG
jgi:predicted unusual protein kinase regulating ubiquinone biosynthesis (AarF/ABC1/UbiB family)